MRGADAVGQGECRSTKDKLMAVNAIANSIPINRVVVSVVHITLRLKKLSQNVNSGAIYLR